MTGKSLSRTPGGLTIRPRAVGVVSRTYFHLRKRRSLDQLGHISGFIADEVAGRRPEGGDVTTAGVPLPRENKRGFGPWRNRCSRSPARHPTCVDSPGPGENFRAMFGLTRV